MDEQPETCLLFSHLLLHHTTMYLIFVSKPTGSYRPCSTCSILVSKSTQTHYNYLLSVGTNGREHSLSPRKCQLGRSFLPSLEFASEGHHRFIVRNYAPSFQLLRPMDPRILTLFCIDEGCQPRYVVTLTYLDQKEPDATLPSI